MNSRIKSILQKSQTLHQEYYDILGSLSEDQLNYKYKEDKWSIVQIAYHIYLSDTGIQNVIMNWSFDRKNEKLGFKSKFNSFMINSALSTSMKFKAPLKTLEQFPEDISANELVNDWRLKCEKFDKFAADFDESKLEYMVFKHPFAGKFNICQSLGFSNYHMIHHKKQIEGIMRRSDFPEN